MAFVTDATSTTTYTTVAGGGSNKVMVISDGTNFYVAIWWANLNVALTPTTTCVVKKLSGTSGAVMWTCEITPAAAIRFGLTMAYITGLGKLHVYGLGVSYSINPTTGVIDGSGTIPGGSGVYAIADGGSVTTSTAEQPISPITGPLNILVAVSNGTVKVANAGGWQDVTSGTSALSATATVIRSAPNAGKLYYADE